MMGRSRPQHTGSARSTAVTVLSLAMLIAAGVSNAFARASGDYVSLAKLKVFQIEEEPGGNGGEQSVDNGRTFVTRLRGCSPNPFTQGTSVNYELADFEPVTLTVHDVSGRLVRRLESGTRQRGIHATRWDGTDSRGHVLPSGVYFVRFSAGDKVSTGRLTLVR